MSDRPLECGACRKTTCISYTEIVRSNVSTFSMCKDCPVLRKRMEGVSLEDGTQELTSMDPERAEALSCSSCGVSVDAIKMGHHLGCKDCYALFSDLLLQEMENSGRIPQELISTQIKESKPIHIGREPGEVKEVNPSLRLIALNEALDDTLSREDYEQAAWLRDQIKALKEKTHGEEK